MYNQKFYLAIKPVLVKLREKLNCDFVVFGSAPLYLYGVLEFKSIEFFNDLDIAVKDKSLIPADAKETTFQKNKDQIFYKIEVDGMNIDIGTLWPGQEDFFNRIFIDPVIAHGFKFANLRVIREWKELMVRKYGRKKDLDYLKRIDGFLGRQDN